MEDRQYYEAHAGVASQGQEPYTAGMGANSHMVGGSHYKSGDATGQCPHCRRQVEHWDWSFNLRGLEYAATKYIARWRDHEKPLDCLKKAIHYIQKIIEIHFPGVVVHVDIGNYSGKGTGDNPQSFAAQRIPKPAGVYNSGEPLAQASRGLEVDVPEPENPEVCPARDVRGNGCHLTRHHLGPHESTWVD